MTIDLRLALRSRLERVRERARWLLGLARTASGLTDYDRWKRVGQQGPTWDERNEIIGTLIRPGSRVLDIGCGSQSLRGYLPESCDYQPCDIVQHDPKVWVWNFNETAFPQPDARFDYVVCSGVAEYAKNPGAFLEAITVLAGEVVLSYAVTESVPSLTERRAAGWFNDLGREALEKLLADKGLRYEHVGAWEGQEIYRVSRTPVGPLPAGARSGPRPRITVCGSFGFGNAGDEGAWMAIEDLARALGFELGFDLLTRFPAPFMKRIIGQGREDSARRHRLTRRPIIYVGGGVIDSSDFCVLLASEPFLKEVGVTDLSLLAVNVETGQTYEGKVAQRLRAMLERARLITVRDELSGETLRKLAPASNPEVIGDIVLWLRPSTVGLPVEVTALPRYVAINAARWSDQPDWKAWISDELVKVSRELDAPLVFVPCSTHFDDDRPGHAELAAAIRSRDPSVPIVEVTQHLDPRQTAGLFARASLTIGMRLHACVMSYANRVPTVGLAYHSKLHGFFRTVGAEDFLIPRQLPSGPHAVSTGFAFAESGIAQGDLLGAARAAIARFPFDRLETLKSRSADAFRRAVGAPTSR